MSYYMTKAEVVAKLAPFEDDAVVLVYIEATDRSAPIVDIDIGTEDDPPGSAIIYTA